jgi:hypothetical protein
VCPRTQAAVPKLPDSAYADDTYAIIHLDGAQVDPEKVEAAAKALLGPQAAMATEGLAKYKEKYTEYRAAGAESLTLVMSGDPNAEKKADPVGYLKLKAGTDPTALMAKIKADQAKEAKQPEMEMAQDGDFVVMHTKGVDLPKGGSNVTKKSFTEILGTADKAVSIAFVPTEQIRAKMKEDVAKDKTQPAWAQSLGTFLSDSQWLLMDVGLGDSPKIGATVQAADEAGAKGIADAVTQGGQQLKAQADQMKAGGPQFAPMADALGGIADALKPTQTGSKVSLSIDGKTVAPAVMNFLPFIMMGAGSGGPKPAPGGAGN